MKKNLITLSYLLAILVTAHFWPLQYAMADEVAITELSISPTDSPQVNEPVTITAAASAAGGKTVYYKFYYCANYGTADYLTTPWTVIQDYSPTPSAEYRFPAAGSYIVVARAVTDPAHEPDALPLIGKTVTVGNGNQVNLTSLTSNLTTAFNAGEPVTFTAAASTANGDDIYYQFYYCANYGTTYYAATSWTMVQAYSKNPTCRITFPADGSYIVVVRAVTDPANEPAALPIIGESIYIGDPDANHKPVASPITLNINSSIPYIQQQLVGSDPDNDTIQYELVSGSSGPGYSQAYANASGMLYVTQQPNGNDTFSLTYRVTDGQLYSDPADVTITVSYDDNNVQDTGRKDVAPEDYAQFDVSPYNSDLLGAAGADPTQPQSVDLSINFPTPGDQGRQSSCVGWATAYALKSYQEKLEMGWPLNTVSHLFSPAFIYNQINGGRDQGAYINEALDLIANTGLATLSTMPYSDSDYLTQPSQAAFAEASQYKAQKWYRVNDTAQIKAALINRKPVVAGIKVYQQLMNLHGNDSVYNTAEGGNLGGHAVTIVGYDNNRYGGAFKIINSWSRNWGDDGYFWMPYSFVAQGALSEAYVLVDAENGQNPAPTEPTVPQPDYTTLPNLTVQSWSATYEPRSRGTGSLTYSVINNGAGTASAGADVNLMLSENTDITGSDYYVVYETIPFDLGPGQSVYRDQNNAISFQFPDQLPAGIYYMALWVDDLGKVAESNENDNISIGNSTITIQNSLPDLNVNTWYAQWDQYGNGTLTYEVINSGASQTDTVDWNINLVLDPDQVIGNGNEIYLFREKAEFYLNPGQYIYRDDASAAHFNLYRDFAGNSVPPGTYFIALWVDDFNVETESNELNNGSYSWGTVPITAGYGARPLAGAYQAGSDRAATPAAANLPPGRAYNGKKLPPRNLLMRKVAVTRTASGLTSFKFLDERPSPAQLGEQKTPKTKQTSSRTGLIFPVTNRLAMPGGSDAHEQ